jgi:hypothetical protein
MSEQLPETRGRSSATPFSRRFSIAERSNIERLWRSARDCARSLKECHSMNIA